MAQLFNSETKLIYISEKIKQYTIGNFRYILWPFYAYKVLIPFPKENKFNLFQKYILKMVDAGITNITEIDTKLQIGKELTAYIFIQLKDSGMINSDNNLTHFAKQLLSSDDELPIEKVAGYIFQSVFSGKLENIFLKDEDLKYVEVEKFGLQTKFIHGSTGNPRRDNGLTIFPNIITHATFDNIDVLKSIIKFRRKKKILSFIEKEDMDETSIPNLVNEVNIISDKIPFWFLAKIFIPKDIRNSSNWFVTDPFGYDLNIEIRKQIIENVNQGNKSLKNEIEKLTDEAFNTDDINIVEMLELSFSDASEKIITVFGNNIKQYPNVYEKLIEFYISYQEFLIAYDNRGKEFKSALKKVENYLRVGYALLEETLTVLNKKYLEHFSDLYLTKYSKNNGRLVSKLFTDKIGFNECEFLEDFFSLSKLSLKSVTQYDVKEFRKLLTVVTLTASEYPKHPLYKLADKLPHFSNFIFKYKKFRDTAAHEENQDYPFENITNIQDYVYTIVSILLENLNLNLQTVVEDMKVVAEYEIKLYQKAKNLIESVLGNFVTQDYQSIFDLLIAIKQNELKLNLIKSVNTLIIKKTETDLIIDISKLWEELLNIIYNRLYTSKQNTNYEIDNITELNNTIKSIGFNCDNISESFYKIKVTDLKNSIKHFNKSVLKDKIVTIIMISAVNRDDTFKEIASVYPNLIKFISEIIVIRDHGDNISLPISQALDISGENILAIKIILSVLNTKQESTINKMNF